jgi:hypothetical protein
MADEIDSEDVPTIKYLVRCMDGDFIIEIPATWKVTFGAVNPGTGDRSYEGGRLHCVRVWESKEKLRAVFCNVSGIRDLSIPLARKLTKETGSAEWSMDSDGSFERNIKRQIAAEYAPDDGDVEVPAF